MGGAYQGSDTLCAGIECPIPCPDATITVDVVTDSAPEETTWELVALSSGTIVASGGPYGQPMTLFSEDICVSSTECYDFTLFDSGNNGITQGGGYQVLYNGVLVGVGFGNFGSQSSVLGIGDGCPTGACCLFSGDCVDDLSEGQCEGLNGTYQGDGSLCSGVNCPLPPTGACCFEDGSCTEALTQMECVSVQGGSWQGSDVTCAAAMCPQPCPDATITVDILTDAAPAETTWEVIEQGSGTVVGSGGPYPGQPFTLFSTDVCVSSTGCYDLIVFDAGGNGLTGGGGWEVFYNGVSVGFGFGNFGDSDEQLNIGDGCVLGACCLTTGDCLDNLTAEQCAGFGGAYQGDDSVCASVTCVASGACCFLDGSCEQLEQVACSTGGGIYEGDGTSCDPSPCPAAGGVLPAKRRVCARDGDSVQPGWRQLSGRRLTLHGRRVPAALS